MPVEVVCPTCNTASCFDQLARDASCFCPTCDYPLFWAKQAAFANSSLGPERQPPPAGRRRLPGTEGWAVAEKLPCPQCAEPNLVTSELCVRCGADLRPLPPPPPRQAPPPPAPRPLPVVPITPPARRRRWWPWVVAAFVPVIGAMAWALVTFA